MTTATPTRPLPRRPTTPPVPHRRGLDLAVAAVLVVAVSAATCWLLGLPTSHLLVSAACYAVVATLVLRWLPAAHAGPGIGPANRVTLGRATLVIPVAALALWPVALTDRGYWWMVGLASVALALDSLDGRVARRTGTVSAFGARFDMELDAFLLLALSLSAWRSGKVGAWVMLIGGLRYLFMLAAQTWPALQEDLPPSVRRKTVCVVQGVALAICLAPVIPPVLAIAVAGGALSLLLYSFGVDVRWLAARYDDEGPLSAEG